MVYETILSELDHFLDALDTLSNNQLSHSVIHPKEMNDLITHVKGVLETTYPNYELIVSEVHDYYNLPFSTFACKDNTLIILMFLSTSNQLTKSHCTCMILQPYLYYTT